MTSLYCTAAIKSRNRQHPWYIRQSSNLRPSRSQLPKRYFWAPLGPGQKNIRGCYGMRERGPNSDIVQRESAINSLRAGVERARGCPLNIDSQHKYSQRAKGCTSAITDTWAWLIISLASETSSVILVPIISQQTTRSVWTFNVWGSTATFNRGIIYLMSL